jgi:hypothetical protein
LRIGAEIGAVAIAVLFAGAVPAAAQAPNIPGGTILQRAQQTVPDKVRFAQQIGAQARVSRDGRLFAMTWSPVPAPRGWIVVLHDRNGWAPDGVQQWHPTLIRKSQGIVAMQWWYGTGEGAAHEAPADIVYRELDPVLRAMNMRPGSLLLFGTGRGAEYVYALAAYDRHLGGKYFSLNVANSGAMAADLLANRRVAEGQFGLGPFDDTRWIFVCGTRDADQERAGCPALRGASDAVRRFGGRNEMTIQIERGTRASFLAERQHVDTVLDRYVDVSDAPGMAALRSLPFSMICYHFVIYFCSQLQHAFARADEQSTSEAAGVANENNRFSH